MQKKTVKHLTVVLVSITIVLFCIPTLSDNITLLGLLKEANAKTLLVNHREFTDNISSNATQDDKSKEIINLRTMPVAECQAGSTFVRGCSKVAFYDNVSYIAYTLIDEISYPAVWRVYVKKYNHVTDTLSEPYYVGTEYRDHTYPCIYADKQGYLHLFFGSRPLPLKYNKSVRPRDPSEWETQMIGQSATYPVPSVEDDKIMVIYREGSSGGAGLDFAINDGGGWSIKRLVEYSDFFVPIPQDVFKKDTQTCFLILMRDGGLLYAPAIGDYHLVESQKESLGIICTEDGNVFRNINGRLLNIPIDYENDYYNYPRVVNEKILTRISDTLVNTETKEYDLSGLNIDGTVLDFTITKENYDKSDIIVKQDDRIISEIAFKQDGRLAFTDGFGDSFFGEYTAGTPLKIRMKYYFSQIAYRVWVDGKVADYYPYNFYSMDVDLQLPFKDISTFVGGTVAFDLSALCQEMHLSFSASALPSNAVFFHYGEADLNSDGILNLSDFCIFGQAYNTTLYDPAYNPNCDFNKDRKVDSYDLDVFELVYTAADRDLPIIENPYYKKAHFEWTPTDSQAGTRYIEFTAANSASSDTETISITVNAPPIPTEGGFDLNPPPEEEPLVDQAMIASDTSSLISDPVMEINKLSLEGGSMHYELQVMNDYKLADSTACYDNDGEVNIIFEKRLDSSEGEMRRTLVHYRNNIPKELMVGPDGVWKRRPSCVVDDDSLYSLAIYTDPVAGDTSFNQIRLLRTEDYENWNDDTAVFYSRNGLANPVFSKLDDSGYKRFVWVDVAEQPVIHYGYFNLINTYKPQPDIRIDDSRAIPFP